MRTCTNTKVRNKNSDQCTAFMHWPAHAQVHMLPLHFFWASICINCRFLDRTDRSTAGSMTMIKSTIEYTTALVESLSRGVRSCISILNRSNTQLA